MINKNYVEKIIIDITEIKNIHTLLLKTKYELSEIWTPDEGNEVQIWSNKELNKMIHLTITLDNPIEKHTTEVVNELVDLWWELRAIRNAVEDNDEDYWFTPQNESNAYEKFYSRTKEFEEEWNDENNTIKKIFKDEIDPTVLAYLYLDDADKLLLTN